MLRLRLGGRGAVFGFFVPGFLGFGFGTKPIVPKTFFDYDLGIVLATGQKITFFSGIIIEIAFDGTFGIGRFRLGAEGAENPQLIGPGVVVGVFDRGSFLAGLAGGRSKTVFDQILINQLAADIYQSQNSAIEVGLRGFENYSFV